MEEYSIGLSIKGALDKLTTSTDPKMLKAAHTVLTALWHDYQLLCKRIEIASQTILPMARNGLKIDARKVHEFLTSHNSVIESFQLEPFKNAESTDSNQGEEEK